MPDLALFARESQRVKGEAYKTLQVVADGLHELPQPAFLQRSQWEVSGRVPPEAPPSMRSTRIPG